LATQEEQLSPRPIDRDGPDWTDHIVPIIIAIAALATIPFVLGVEWFTAFWCSL
jgi:hypothetical protein